MSVNTSPEISHKSIILSESSNENNESIPVITRIMKLKLSPKIVPVSTHNASKETSKNDAGTKSPPVNSESIDTNNSYNVVDIKKNEVIDSELKGENLQQLSTNALPPYSPSSPPNFINNDAALLELHCCTHCGDTFTSKSSLTFHLARRSVLIKFPCDTCKSVHIFYNRCILQSHIRSHADKEEVSDISKATVNPLPRVFMDGIHTEFVNNLDDEFSSLDDTEETTPSELLEFSIKEIDNEISNTREKQTVNGVKLNRVKCLDCNQEFDSVKDRKEHITNRDKIPVIVSHCEKCGMVCPSKCSLKAHQRIHLQISPYVCPECGESPNPHWSNFLHHVNFECFHNCRSIGYKCPVCKRISPSNDSLLKHMELHTEKYLKCDACPRAYLSSSAFESHNILHHQGKIVSHGMIYKCSLCDIVFLASDQMLSHRSAHLKEQTCEYVFSCMQCGKTLDSKENLLEHIKLNHPKIYKQVNRNEVFDYKPEKAPVVYKGKVECLICRCVFHSHQGYSVHISRAHININQKCALCFDVLHTRKEMVKHGITHINRGHNLCLFCNNKAFADNKSLDAHLLSHVERLRYCTFCPTCNQQLAQPLEALQHLREEHKIANLESAKNFRLNTSLQTISCHFCRLFFVTENALQEHLRKEHSVSNDQSMKRSFGDDATNDLLVKKQRIEGSACAKCDFSSIDRVEFKKHIQSHKTNKSSFQCQECGLCFVVEPSLQKHLKIVHKIGDPKKYILEEGTNFAPDLESPTEITTRNALECGVCYTTFPSESSLKIHMRSHGMAFIQTKTSSIAL